MKAGNGHRVTEKNAVADVFVCFYEELYRRRGLDTSTSHHGCPGGSGWVPLTPFLFSDLLEALKAMQTGRAKDDAGIVAEMVKASCAELLQCILEVFNKILTQEAEPPDKWKSTKLVVIFKKGDIESPKNYRPIAILPILYKLFSRMLCNRMTAVLMRRQDVDQAAYRKGFSTEDHLITVLTLIERSREFSSPLWMALVDFEKAFDTVDHASLWRVLREQSVPERYIMLLGSLYDGQLASVQAGARSRSFPIQRGVKQGDPLSALLFIAVMQDLCGRLKIRWAKANYRRTGLPFGVEIAGASETLMSLRFADDVVLLSQSKSDITKMLVDFSKYAAEYGLRINFEKTKILTWDSLSRGISAINIGENAVQVLPETKSEKYLGAKVSFQDARGMEFRNRVAAAWGAFHKYKGELCSKSYPLKDRIRLFDAVVTPTMLYACSTWTLTTAMEKELSVIRRKMLRYVFRIFRPTTEAGLESWVDYLQRSAKRVDDICQLNGSVDWKLTYRRRKWRFAGKIARQMDGRWSKLVLQSAPPPDGSRDRGHPRLRWSDDLVKYAGGNWMTVANDEVLWGCLEEGFVDNVQ